MSISSGESGDVAGQEGVAVRRPSHAKADDIRGSVRGDLHDGAARCQLRLGDVGDLQRLAGAADARCPWLGAQRSATATYFTSRYSRMPSWPPSRPKPECLTPPKGAAAFETIPWFSPTIPVWSDSTTRRARPRSRV
jgi:hypothetical protein